MMGHMVDDSLSMSEKSMETLVVIGVQPFPMATKRRYADVVKVLSKFKVQKSAKTERAHGQRMRVRNCIGDAKMEVSAARRSVEEDCGFKADHLGLGLNLVAFDKSCWGHVETGSSSSSSASSKPQQTESRAWSSVTSETTTTRSSWDKVRKSVSDSIDVAIKFRIPWHILRRQQSKDEIVPWLNERIQVSCRPVVFGLPGDIRDLQNLTIQSYLAKFCKIPHERMVVFTRVFKKFKNKETNLIPQKVLVPAIVSLLYNCVTSEEVNGFLGKMKLKSHDLTYDLKAFARVAAVAERVLYLSYAEAAGSVPLGVLRTFQETADFSALEGRLRDLNMNPFLKRLLMSL